ncbi:capsule biosynthesis GfcC D2 domain-containing protein [Pantoea sp. BAV 3049]|uniref:capsule biosynthesis GfcC D2 domain-containing protein n=1 Tax=Pantoea sp. BAV 3049 TaxID=2654188 RepID=UPI00131B0661|nr:capsule biosynthesis GfcC D2 domain-containing protein [Pantoea sp. BAV 3049]
MKKITSLLAGMAACVSLSVSAESQVTVFYPGQTQTAVVRHAQNLAQLVTSPELKGKTWWPGTVIAEKMATAVALQQQQQLLARLKAWSNELHADDDADKAAVVDNLLQQVAAVKVTGRQIVNLDPDWVRVRAAENRRLEGDYSVYTLREPTNVTLAGLVSGSGKTPWLPGRTVVDYLGDHDRLVGAERNFATVIAPSGETTEVPIAYWNRRHVEPETGSIIYVGFSSWSLPGQYADLNQQIISVLTHRIPD